MWKSPDYSDLRLVCGTAEQQLVVCSPFVGAQALRQVSDSLSESLQRIEIFTRLSTRDWVAGATDVIALRQFVEEHEPVIHLRHSDLLHAKFVLADSQRALAGSANLTRAGYNLNLEAAALIEPHAIEDFLPQVDRIRQALSPITLRDFYGFAERCEVLERDREAIVDLLREQTTHDEQLIPLSEFVRILEQGDESPVAESILDIRYNRDRNNRTGHLKQSYYAVQRFLREHDAFIEQVAGASLDDAYEPSGDLLTAWRAFIEEHLDEANDVLDYAFSVLHHELPPSLGGTRRGGGGASRPFKLVWVPVAQMLRDMNA